MRRWILVVGILLATGCHSATPTSPQPPVVTPSLSAPYYLSLGASIGQGNDAGHAMLTARVQNVLGTELVAFPVRFTTSAGTLGAELVLTDAAGVASTTLTASTTAKVSVTAGSKTTDTMVVAIAPPPPPPPIVIPPPPPPPIPPPAPPPPSPSYSVTVVAAPTAVVLNGSSTLTATATPQNGATAATSYAWDCNGDGGIETTTAVNFTACTYLIAGTVTSRVIASNGTVSNQGSVAVTVAAAAPLFVAISAPTPSPVLINVNSTYTGTVTSSGAIPATLQWEWDYDDDGTPDAFASGASPQTHSFSYGSADVMTLKLTVRDPATGRTATTSRTVTVQ